MKYFPLLEPWLDPKYKLITQPPPEYDGGDTAQREGMFMFGAFMLFNMGLMDANEMFFIQDRYAKVCDTLNDPNHPGFLRRFPDPSYWGSYSDRFSRDQAIPNVIAMSYLATKAQRDPSKHLWKFFLRHLKYSALLFMDNTRANAAPADAPWKLPDLTLLSFHSLYIRSFRAWPLYPLMLIFDLDLLVNSLIKILYYDRTSTNNDDLNHLMCLYQSELHMPTPWSKLAKWLYRFRKFPSLAGNATNPAQACLNSYFNGNNPGPRLDLVYQEITAHFS